MLLRYVSAGLSLVGVLVVVACGILTEVSDCGADNDASPGIQGTLGKFAGDADTVTAGGQVVLTVILKDVANQGLCLQTINWTASPGSGSANPAQSTTKEGLTLGQASTTWTVGTTLGNQTLTAMAAGAIPPLSVTFTANVTAVPAADCADDDGVSDATEGTLSKLAGDAQTVTAGGQVVLTVKLVDVKGEALCDVGIEWGGVVGSGSANPPQSQTRRGGPLEGQASTTWTVGTTLGNQTLIARVLVSSPQLSVTFTANVTAPPALCPGATRTWTGTVSNDWHSPDNWNPTGVPGQTDDVCVPAGLPRYPRIDAADADVRDLVGEAGALLSGQFNLNIWGDLNWAGTTAGNFGIVRLVGASGTVQGTMTPLLVMGNYTVTGRLTVATRLIIEPGKLTLNGHTVTVGQLEVGPGNALGSGQLVMTNPLDSLLTTGVSASVFFNGGDHTGLLTAGILQVGGNFTQFFGTTSFVASGTHRTVFTAGTGTHTVQMFSPQAHFGDLDVSAAGWVNFVTNAIVQGRLIADPLAGTPTLAHTSAGVRLLTVGQTYVQGLNLSRLRLLINNNDGYTLLFQNVSFTDFQNLSGTRLEVRHPGWPGIGYPFKLSFADVPAAGGYYLSADDTDPTTPPLTINVINSSPASGAPYVLTANGAVVNW